MHKLLVITILFLSALTLQAQELNCTVTVDAQRTGQPNQQIFRTLEKQLTEFVNNTNWTTKEVKNQERIDCNMSIIINEYDSNVFKASIQIQASRPVFGSVYDSPIYNYNDKQFSFTYSEFEPLNFNANVFESNLVSVITYHIYTVLGLDAGSFALNGGEEYFDIAKQIISTAGSSNFSGWKSTDGTQSRYRYNAAVISPVYSEFHTALYKYHIEGLDLMVSEQKVAKNNIKEAIAILKKINDRRPNAYLLRTFFDAKSDEIQKIFSGGPKVDITQLVENLNRMAPTKRKNWGQITY